MSIQGAGTLLVLLKDAIAVVNGAFVIPIGKDRTFQAFLSGTGVLSATVAIQVSNDPRVETDAGNAKWITLGTISLSDTTTTAGLASVEPWKYTRAAITAISGTAATVSAILAV